jgi:hypothetical protein
MRPADELIVLPEKMLVAGTPKLVMFAMLKNSARNCRLLVSRIGVVLKSEKSKSAMPGPLIIPRPALPYVPNVGRL